MDASIDYIKNEKNNLSITNKRNDYSTKTIKNQSGEFLIEIPRDRNRES